MRIISVVTQKGGCAKTTTAWAMGTGLHARGYNVLLVDADPQSSLAFTAGVNLLELPASLYDVFKGRADVNDALLEIEPGLDIVVGSMDLTGADREFTGRKAFYLIGNAIHGLRREYDFVIIDTPSYLGCMTENALAVSDDVIVPAIPDVYALQGAGQLAGFIDRQRAFTNSGLKVAGVLMVLVENRTSMAKLVLSQVDNIAQLLNTKVFQTRIRQGVKVKEAAANRTSLIKSYKSENVTKDYEAFIDEYLRG